uniref:ShKL1 n=1 Tax=Colubraria reticulata TaxID=604273 RepID=A0A481SP22_9CAEN|nr:ShKL1 [Colubraria reticulata]
MKAVLAACCLFAVYLLFRSGDADQIGPNAAPGVEMKDFPGPCLDSHKKPKECESWKNASFCTHPDHEYVRLNCKLTCTDCTSGAGDEPPPYK